MSRVGIIARELYVVIALAEMHRPYIMRVTLTRGLTVELDCYC